jgi:hypothetical protein
VEKFFEAVRIGVGFDVPVISAMVAPNAPKNIKELELEIGCQVQ